MPALCRPFWPPIHSHLQQPLHVLPRFLHQGRWREVASRFRAASPGDAAGELSAAAYHLLALLKLNMLQEAAAELAKLAPLPLQPLPPSGGAAAGAAAAGAAAGAAAAGAAVGDGPTGGTASAAGSSSDPGPAAARHVPFALRRIHAELPWWLGRQQEGVDRLYALLTWCAAQQASAAALRGAVSGGGGGEGGAEAAAAAQLWRRRHRDVLMTLVGAGQGWVGVFWPVEAPPWAVGSSGSPEQPPGPAAWRATLPTAAANLHPSSPPPSEPFNR